ncbi:hypothetical protein [Nonomuraea sp. NPDC049309]|uniref:hypothetical protein n=1 Tax=Nonomuraea sp. NPDC049309 TaxID=3364350 RepID=UPI00371ADFBB
MRSLAHVAHPDDALAFPAFYALTAPAIRAAASGPLRRARHAGAACHAPIGSGFCAECEATIDDLILTTFTRLRGPLPTTRSGEPVRELALVREHLTSPEAANEDVTIPAHALRRPPSEGEAAWLRAARAQLVHYPLARLEEKVRRDDAVRRGAAARPDRDLRQAAWAAPLRTDPVALDLLIFAVFRARRGTPERDIPADLCERHGLSQEEARRRLNAALRRLRTLNPAFYAANLGDEPFARVPWTTGCAPSHDADPDREDARQTLRHLLTQSSHVRRRTYETVISHICAAAQEADHASPIDLTTIAPNLTPADARHLFLILTPLVVAAGLDWCEAQCATASALPRTHVDWAHAPTLVASGQREPTLASAVYRG